MKGHIIGYVRGSTYVQNPDRQLEGIETDTIFPDKASGKDVKRPQLEALLSFVLAGDTVIVHRMDRLARNLDDLRRLVQVFTVAIPSSNVVSSESTNASSIGAWPVSILWNKGPYNMSTTTSVSISFPNSPWLIARSKTSLARQRRGVR